MKSLNYFLLVFVLTIPFWLVGALAGDLAKVIPINLPISALMAFCPLIAAVILVHREDKSGGIKNLFKRIFDYKKNQKRTWYIPVILLMPVVMFLSYGVMRLINLPLPEPQIPLEILPVFLIVFFISAIGEEVGWSGYIIDPMQNQWGALKGSLILGFVWAIWHILPNIQANHSASWIVWQSLCTVCSRVIITWLYNNTGKSVFAAILYHCLINVSVFLFPNYGSHYNPLIVFIIEAAVIVLIVYIWGTRTMTRYRF